MNPFSSGEWLKTKDAVKRLQSSRSHLHRLKKDGYLKAKTHFIRLGIHQTSPLMWNIDAVAESMGKWTVKRG
jgi:hypothetical protein